MTDTDDDYWTVVLLHGFDSRAPIEQIEYNGRVWLEPIFDEDDRMIALAFPSDNVPNEVQARITRSVLPFDAVITIEDEEFPVRCPIDVQTSIQGMRMVPRSNGSVWTKPNGHPYLVEDRKVYEKCRDWVDQVEQDIREDKAKECFERQAAQSARSLNYCYERYEVSLDLPEEKRPSKNLLDMIIFNNTEPLIDLITEAGDSITEEVCNGPLAAVEGCSFGGGVGRTSDGDYFLLSGDGKQALQRPYVAELIALPTVERKPASMAPIIARIQYAYAIYKSIMRGYKAGDQGQADFLKAIADYENAIDSVLSAAAKNHPQGDVVHYVVLEKPGGTITAIPSSEYEVPLDARVKVISSRVVFGRNFEMALDQGYDCDPDTGFCSPPKNN